MRPRRLPRRSPGKRPGKNSAAGRETTQAICSWTYRSGRRVLNQARKPAVGRVPGINGRLPAQVIYPLNLMSCSLSLKELIQRDTVKASRKVCPAKLRALYRSRKRTSRIYARTRLHLSIRTRRITNRVRKWYPDIISGRQMYITLPGLSPALLP